MKLGVFSAVYRESPFEEALDRLAALGVDAVEIPTGVFPSTIGSFHCDVEALVADARKRKAFASAIEDRGLTISALSAHSNPLDPNEQVARDAQQLWERTVQLAELLEVPVVVGFSGCPGDHAAAKLPNWVTCAWPPEFLEVLDWQWEQRVIPYWSKAATAAEAAGVKIAIEMHPGFVVYNPETLLRLRDATGPAVGANFDPSHLFWQGIDAVSAIKLLADADALHYVHAKDTQLDAINVARNGVLDTKRLDDVARRSWIFRTVGYGASDAIWRDILSTLRAVGYDEVLSIEHEDGLASIEEGLTKAVRYLQDLMFREPAMEIWWAD